MSKTETEIYGLFFEVMPKPGHEKHYFEHVERLKPALANHTGLLWLQRYKDADQANLILSHQLWDGESSLANWRHDRDHRKSQIAGMTKHFADYRIRVGRRIWDFDQGTENGTLPVEGDLQFVLTVHGAAPAETAAFAGLGTMHRRFINVIEPTRAVLLISLDHVPTNLCDQIKSSQYDAAALFEVSRDYGMFDRNAAPKAK